MNKPKPIPDGFHTVTPYLIVNEGRKALDFYQRAFGAVPTMIIDGPDGKVGHAELRIGNSIVMLGDEHPDMGAISPKTLGGTPTGLCIYVEDCDQVFSQAVAAGAEVVRPVADLFYGDRAGTLLDPFGHKWTIGTHIEDVSPEEIKRRLAAMMSGSPQ